MCTLQDLHATHLRQVTRAFQCVFLAIQARQEAQYESGRNQHVFFFNSLAHESDLQAKIESKGDLGIPECGRTTEVRTLGLLWQCPSTTPATQTLPKRSCGSAAFLLKETKSHDIESHEAELIAGQRCPSSKPLPPLQPQPPP